MIIVNFLIGMKFGKLFYQFYRTAKLELSLLKAYVKASWWFVNNKMLLIFLLMLESDDADLLCYVESKIIRQSSELGNR